MYIMFLIFVRCTHFPLGLVALKHVEEKFSSIFNRFLISLFVFTGFDWFGKNLSNTDLIILVNITSVGVMANGAF